MPPQTLLLRFKTGINTCNECVRRDQNLFLITGYSTPYKKDEPYGRVEGGSALDKTRSKHSTAKAVKGKSFPTSKTASTRRVVSARGANAGD